MKTCTKCGEEKPLTEYYRDKRATDGRTSACIACARLQGKAWRERSTEKIRQKNAKHYAENRERYRVVHAEWRSRNLEKVRAISAAYREANREAIRASDAAYYAENRERTLDRNAQHYWANRERYSELRREYRAEKPHVAWEGSYRSRARKFDFEPAVESFTREELIGRYGNACHHCGGPFEELDHYPVPVLAGGAHSLGNCVPSCTPCNALSWRNATEEVNQR